MALQRSSRQSSGFSGVLVLLAVASFIAWLGSNERAGGDRDDEDSSDIEAIARDLEPSGDQQPAREGIAAVVLMDVSGSMAQTVTDAGIERPKIEIARAAAEALVGQFATYAKAHPDEPVLVGLLEFSERSPSSAREVIPLSPADPVRAKEALARMRPDGGTPIGDAIVEGKRVLDRSGLSRRHLLVVTDGENTDGREPEDVLKALKTRPDAERPSIYFVAFDIAASRFNGVRDAGGLVWAASNAEELDKTLDSLLTGKILVEGP